MAAWPKSFISLGATFLTSRTGGQLRRRDRGTTAQEKAFTQLVRQLAATSFWREAGVVPGMKYDAFRTRIPPRRYESFVPAIERMYSGLESVLWPGRCPYFVTSAGTTGAMPKMLPVSDALREHFRTACQDILLYYMARVGNTGVLRGHPLQLTGSTALQPVGNHTGALVGNWPAIATQQVPKWMKNELEPGPQIGEMADWQAKVDATIARTANRNISLVAGLPPWILAFAETCRTKAAESRHAFENLQSWWRNLECYVHGGVPVGPFESELRTLLGPTVNFHEVYASAEGVFAIQDGAANDGLRLLVERGLFFEFLPFSDFDEARLEQLGDRVISLAEVKTNVDYVLLLTSPAGVARYVVGDIIRFTSTEPPRLIYVGRTALQLNAFGEHVIEKEVTDALIGVCTRHRWTIVNFHVAPLMMTDLTGQSRGRHEWWVELRPGTVETPTGPQMAVELDLELQRLNRDYTERRRSGRVESPIVRLVMPGVFKHWMKFRGTWGGQNKIARCRSDRAIADELAHLTRFAAD